MDNDKEGRASGITFCNRITDKSTAFYKMKKKVAVTLSVMMLTGTITGNVFASEIDVVVSDEGKSIVSVESEEILYESVEDETENSEITKGREIEVELDETESQEDDPFMSEATIKEKIETIIDDSGEMDSSEAGIAANSGYMGNSGECGASPNQSDILWVLDNEGTLTISGSGKMASWENGFSPWINNQSIKKIIVGNGILNIGDRVFEDCSSVESIFLGNDLQTIGMSAFLGCKKISEVVIPGNVSTIDAYAFAWCDNLKTISLPDSIERIANGTFWDCTSLESIILPSKITSLESYLFDGCSNLQSVIISGNIHDISHCVFRGCISLKGITLPNSLKRISSTAFENCKSLTSVIIPGSVGEIASDAFDGSTGVEIVGYAGTFAEEYANVFNIPFIEITHTHLLEEVELYEATCYENGLKRSVCKECGLEKIEIIESKGHDVVIDKGVAPSCKVSGLTEGSHCSLCGEVFVVQEEIPATGHFEIIDESKDATCTESGLTEGSHCSVCGEILTAQKIISATGHSVILDKEKLATCTESGLTEGSHCSVCGEVLVPQTIMPATGHTWEKEYTIDTEATCTEEGSKSIHCANCSASKDNQVIPAKGHSFGSWNITKAATIHEEGLQERICSICNFTEEEKIPRITELNITPTIILSSTQFVYNGQVLKPTVKVINDGEEISPDYYTISFDANPIAVGTYNVLVDMKDVYKGNAAASYSIIPKTVTPTVSLSSSSYIYNGKIQKPSVTVKDGDFAIPSENYTVDYGSGLTNVGTYSVTVTMKGNYSGTGTASYTIYPKTITPEIALSDSSFTYNGKSQKPTVKVKDESGFFEENDYTVSYDPESKNVGTYNVKVTMTGNYSGTGSTTYKIKAKAVSPKITLSKTSFIYNGKAQKPTVTVKDGTTVLPEANYTVSYASGLKNVGNYKVSVKLKGNYSGSGSATYKITAKQLTPTVTLSKTAYVYNGKVQTPAVTVKDGGTKLATDDYSVKYDSGRTNVGSYKIEVKLNGNYSGSKTISFDINPKGTALSTTKADKNQITVNWKKQASQTTGYQIQYSTKNDFSSGNKSVTINKTAQVSTVIKSLATGGTYYVRIRTYKTIGKTKLYSAWSAGKTIDLPATPGVPKITAIKKASSTSLTISWSKAKYAQKYEVYASVDNSSYKKVGTTTALSFTHSKLTMGKLYSYKIVSVRGSKKSGYSSIKSFNLPVVLSTKTTMLGQGVQTLYDKVKYPSTLHIKYAKYEVGRINGYGDKYDRCVVVGYAMNGFGGYSEVYAVVLRIPNKSIYEDRFEIDGEFYIVSVHSSEPGLTGTYIDGKTIKEAYYARYGDKAKTSIIFD